MNNMSNKNVMNLSPVKVLPLSSRNDTVDSKLFSNIEKSSNINLHTIPTSDDILKSNDKLDKIKNTLINNWIQNGFVEKLRGQIRCQLIDQLKTPFKSHQNVHESLSLRIRLINSMIIDYLSKRKYNYSLSVFKSEIGGELIGSLSTNDTLDQLNLNKDFDENISIIQYLINSTNDTNNVNTKNNTFVVNNQLIVEQQRLEKLRNDLEKEITKAKKEAKYEVEMSLKEEISAVRKLQQELHAQLSNSGIDGSAKFKLLQNELDNANKTIASLNKKIDNQQSIEYTVDTLSSNQLNTNESVSRNKYQKVYKELMETLSRENELQSVIDEQHIKLRSTAREVQHLEQLLNTQHNLQDENNINVNATQITASKQSDNTPQLPIIQNNVNQPPISHINNHHIPTQQPLITNNTNSTSNITTKNCQKDILCKKYDKLEKDLKKRLQIQASLETDTRKLSYSTQQFFKELNKQKQQTSQIINKLQSSTPKFEHNHFIQSYNEHNVTHIDNTINQQYEEEKRQNKQRLIYYNLDKLREERNQIQQGIRKQIIDQSLKQTNSKVIQNEDIKEEEIQEEQNKIEKISIASPSSPSIPSSPSSPSSTEPTQNANDNDVNIVSTITISSNKETPKKTELIENVSDVDDIHEDEQMNDIGDDANLENSNPQNSVILSTIDEQKEIDTNSNNKLIVIEKEEEIINNNTMSDEEDDADERERLEREKLEQDLMGDGDGDYAQSESFSGIAFLHTDFLEKYQKHIENTFNQT